ncbi:cytochrome b [Pollutimonas harenae]|uniref:Cytochrome b n=1 Tax=Pollutimonas harenae TaxID=657015 RepID=A0A853GWL7_9BURK|nr:cytochrome b [Pollutimonas harenae]NYT86741.1 cytochrome b [Pollutimonas harenae]TEA71390.1 cytochrome b [Pollutimonas harenae]
MEHRYTRTAIFLHWLVAAGLIGTFTVGFFMQDLPLSPTKLKVYSWHKWAGVTLLLLVATRLCWRLTHAAPPLPTNMSPTARFTAHAAHWLLYALMLAIPLSGWTMSSAVGFPVVWFGVIQLPDLVPKDKALGAALKQAHQVLNYTLLVMVIAHLAAALKHHFIDRDTVLSRMLPYRKK